MKNNLFRSIFYYSAIVIASIVVFTSCNDDDDDGEDPNVLVEDGIYLVGEGTVLTEIGSKGMMKVTKNEVTQEDRSTLYEIYIPVKAGSDGFSIVEVAGKNQKNWGPATEEKGVGGHSDHIKPDYVRGKIEESEKKFTVDADGLYHIIIDTELKMYVVAPVTHWAVIGAATPGGWSDETKLEAGAFGLEKMSFSATDIQMAKGDFKIRYSGGWKVIVDSTIDLGGGDKGVLVNANFGGSTDELVPGGDNISFSAIGFYTITMDWTLESGYSATLTKTGDVEPIDYTKFEMGLIGDGISEMDTAWGWNDTYKKQMPTVKDTDYTWKWEGVKVIAEKSFKIRQGDNWDGKSIGFNDVTMKGDGAASFETNGDGNFVIKASGAGTYDFELFIDALSEEYTFTATKK